MRVLGLDFGQARVGVALSDPLMMVAQPLPFLENNPSLIDNILSLIQSHEVSEVVVGSPKTLKGEVGSAHQMVDQFISQLKNRYSGPIKLWDERFSTHAANRILINADLSRKKRKQKIDSQAAVFFLQGYLDFLTHQNKKG